jgi:hypothetical protein
VIRLNGSSTISLLEDVTRVFILAHSAGGLHVAGYLLASFSSSSAAHLVRGVVFMGVPYEISPSRAKFYAVARLIMMETENESRRMAPLCVASQPSMRYLIAGSVPHALSIAMRNFTSEFKSKGEELVLEGRDHLSPLLSLSSGTSEGWGEDLVEWIWSH